MSTWISEQAFSRLQIRDKMSVPDGTRTTNLVMACHLMFLYSNYRLIGIAHQQATQPMTEQEANERACLLNGLFSHAASAIRANTQRRSGLCLEHVRSPMCQSPAMMQGSRNLRKP